MRSRTRDAHERVERELVQEKASALGRAGERLEAALAVVAAIGRCLDATVDPEERGRVLDRYEAARARALHARLALLIQREAVGLRSHRAVDQQFPEPPRRGTGSAPRPS